MVLDNIELNCCNGDFYSFAALLLHLTLPSPVWAPGCKNSPARYPGRMSYKATNPGLVLFYILACFNCISK